MGLLGTGGITHGATPYLPNRWYFVELRFDWENKEVPLRWLVITPCARPGDPMARRRNPVCYCAATGRSGNPEPHAHEALCGNPVRSGVLFTSTTQP